MPPIAPPYRFVRALAALLIVGCGSTAPYQGMTADEVFELGLREFEEGDYGHAIEAFERILIAFAGYERAPDVRLKLAETHFHRKEYLSAQSEYVRFLDRHAVHPAAPEAALGVCRSLAALSPIPDRDQTYTQDAVSTCRNVVTDYRGTPQAVQAAEVANEMRAKLAHKDLLNAEHYYRRKMYDSAIVYYEFVVDLYPETEWAPTALLGIYRANLKIGYDDVAEEVKRQLLAQYPDSPAAKEIVANGGGEARGG